MAGNSSLNAAAAAKKDEFYTQLSDIEKELRHYRKHFKNKVVLCNCDDPFESNFFKYFALNFNRLGLKQLLATCYSGSPITGTQLALFGDETEEERRVPYKAVVNVVRDVDGDGGVDMFDVAELFRSGENTLTRLEGDGDYRSPECLELLAAADIVVTNPPFSLFREFVLTLVEHQKKFVVIGNQNAITYKEIFPLLKNNEVWLGYGFPGNVGFFESPYEDTAAAAQHKEGMIRVSGVMWFTNLDIKKRHEDMILVKRYDPELHRDVVNFDGIDINKTAEIPYDYAGLMGVPVTFMTKYNPDQFELLGTSLELAKPMKDFAEKGTYMQGGKRFYTDRLNDSDRAKGYLYHREYDRLIIRNKRPEEPRK